MNISKSFQWAVVGILFATWNSNADTVIKLTPGGSTEILDANGEVNIVSCASSPTTAGSWGGRGTAGGRTQDSRKFYLSLENFPLLEAAKRGIGNCRVVDNRYRPGRGRPYPSASCDFYLTVSQYVMDGSGSSSFFGCWNGFNWDSIFDTPLDRANEAAAMVRKAIKNGYCI